MLSISCSLMNPDDLIKAAPAIAKGAAEIIAAVPIADIVKRICGPPADLLGDKLRERVERCFEKTARMTQDTGVTPQAVPPKLLLPILQGASVEENEDLHTMWAALLANAASPENAQKVRPGFTAILKQMAPDEALLLKWIFAKSQGWTPHIGGLDWFKAQAELGFTSKEEATRSRRIDLRMATCLDGLEAQQLIRRTYFLPSSSSSLDEPRKFEPQQVNFRLMLTERGTAFFEACQPPKPKA